MSVLNVQNCLVRGQLKNLLSQVLGYRCVRFGEVLHLTVKLNL